MEVTEPQGLRERRRARTFESILGGAREVFLERGYDATSLLDIARRADISAGTVRNYFGNKDAVFAALIDAEQKLLIERLATAAGELKALEETVSAVFAAAFERFREAPEIYSMAQRNMPAVRRALDFEPLRGFVDETLRRPDKFNHGIGEQLPNGAALADIFATLTLELGHVMLNRPAEKDQVVVDFLAGLATGAIIRMRAEGAAADAGAELAAKVEAERDARGTEQGEEPQGLRERQKADTRAAILQAARDSFAEAGFTATGMREIAARADVAPATIYNYFDDKEAIFCVLADEYFGLFGEQMRSCRARTRDLEEEIGAQFRIAYKMTAENPVLFELMLRNLWEVRQMMPELASLSQFALEMAGDSQLMVEQKILPPLDVELFTLTIVSMGFEVGRLAVGFKPPDFAFATKFATDFFTGGILFIGGRDPTKAVELSPEPLQRG
ncbi:MAG: TetR/AcrR family transcriptional regulator [Solirubrobacterales bacterium]